MNKMDYRTMRPLRLLFTPKSKCFLCFRYRLANFITGGELITRHQEIRRQVTYLEKFDAFHTGQISRMVDDLQNGVKSVYR